MKLLTSLEKFTVYLIVFLLVLCVVPVLPAAFILPKEILLTSGVAFLLLIWSIKLVAKGRLDFSTGKFDLAVLLLALSYLASAVLKTPNKMEAFWLPGIATFVIASTLFYFLINQLTKESKEKVSQVIFASATVFSLLVLFGTTGLSAKIPQLPELMKTATFNTLGSSLQAAIFLAVGVPLGIGPILKQKDLAVKLFSTVCLTIVILALLVSVKNTLPTKEQSFGVLDLNSSWQISVEALKTSPVLGIGPGNYLTAFRRWRPLTFNQTDYWANYFTSGGNFYLTVLTEAGLAAVISLILLLAAVYKRSLKNNFKEGKLISLVLLLVLFAFFPISAPIIVLLFVFLALNSGSEEKMFHVNFLAQSGDASGFASRIPSFIVSLPVIALVFAFVYLGSRYSLAEYKFKKALDSLVKNEAKATYDLIGAAIRLNPKVDRYRFSYSQINLALAGGIAQKKDLTDADRTAVTQLIQQSIQEAKAAVVLNPTRSDNWSLLANTYRSIMAFAQGADTFTVQSVQQAIALDPINPNLRIYLGGVYYALGRFDDAIEAFKLAILAKPDLANAHYNLSAAFREKGDIEKAISEMNVVLGLVKLDSPDYKLAKDELANMEKKRPSSAKAPEEQAGDLTPPQKAPEPVIKPPIELPEEVTPPASP